MNKYLMVGAYPNYFNTSFFKQFKDLNLFSKYDCLVTSKSESSFNRGVEFDEYFSLDYSPVNIKYRLLRRVAVLFYIFYKYIYFLIVLNRYDVLHVQSMSFYHVVFLPLLRLKSNRLCVTFWGSDFNLASPLKKKVLCLFLRYVDSVSTTSSKMKRDLIDELGLEESKITITRFGLPTAKFIDMVSAEEIEMFRVKYSVPEDKVVVMCAPSSDPIRQIIEVIDGILELPSDVFDKAFFIFHLGYGDESYKVEVLAKLSTLNNSSYVVICDFLRPELTAALRRVTHVYVNVAIADQLSGAMLEAVYCNNIILIGEWLEYLELKEREIEFLPVPTMNKELFSRSLKKGIEAAHSECFPNNSEKIRDLLFWDQAICHWKNFLTG